MRPPPRAVWLLSIAIVLLLSQSSCGLRVDATFEPGVEHLAPVGSFHLEGDPAFATVGLSLRYVSSDGNVSRVKDEFQPNQRVVVDRTTPAGEHGVTVNGARCQGTFQVEAGLETDLVLQVRPEGCQTVVTVIHEPGLPSHEEVFGRVTGAGPVGARIRVVSLDDPPNATFESIADESGVFAIEQLSPGRYRLDASSADGFVRSIELEVWAGESTQVDLYGALPSPSG